MVSIAQNRELWTAYNWPQCGDEWSSVYGTAYAQWTGSIYPRVFPFLQGAVLEIAPGYGRWTQFLLNHCTSLVGVDLTARCIEHCRQRFNEISKVRFVINDGLRLPMVQEASIDFVFSFDSLVHAEAEVLSSYVDELARVLKPNATGFIHHSNLATVRRTLLDPLRGIPTRALRARSMSAEKMRELVQRSGMSCIQQEIIPWEGKRWPALTDCLTTIIKAPGINPTVFKNRRFLDEASAIKRLCAASASPIAAEFVCGTGGPKPRP